jgi:hypothetical protein
VFRIAVDIVLFSLWLLNWLKWHLENTQPPPTMDEIVLVTFDGLLHGATNEPMTSMLED